ncbi:MAG: HNH endonuclease [Armatimonadota bacterium]
MTNNTPRIERYLAKVDQRGPDECWAWNASRNQFGYGTFKGDVVDGKQEQLAHRYGYRHLVGPIPEGMNVCHRCDNPSCQNPAHWFLGDPKANSDDKIAKNRAVYPSPAQGRRNGNANLTETIVAEIRERSAQGERQSSIAADFGINQTAVSKIVRRVRWGHVP